MKEEQFFKEMLEALELSDVTIDRGSVLQDLPGFDSLSILCIISYTDQTFGERLTADQMSSLVTVNDLMNAIGSAHFE